MTNKHKEALEKIIIVAKDFNFEVDEAFERIIDIATQALDEAEQRQEIKTSTGIKYASCRNCDSLNIKGSGKDLTCWCSRDIEEPFDNCWSDINKPQECDVELCAFYLKRKNEKAICELENTFVQYCNNVEECFFKNAHKQLRSQEKTFTVEEIKEIILSWDGVMTDDLVEKFEKAVG